MADSDYIFKMFARQFKRKGAGFVYRYNLRGAPIPVTAAERDTFVAEFRRNYRLFPWLMMAVIMVVVVLVWALGGADSKYVGVFVGIALIPILAIAGTLFVWRAPQRSLAKRAAVGEPLSRDAVRRMTLNSLGYKELAALAVASFAIFGLRPWQRDVLHGWGWLWLAPGAGLALLAAVQAFRKWRMQRPG